MNASQLSYFALCDPSLDTTLVIHGMAEPKVQLLDQCLVDARGGTEAIVYVWKRRRTFS